MLMRLFFISSFTGLNVELGVISRCKHQKSLVLR